DLGLGAAYVAICTVDTAACIRDLVVRIQDLGGGRREMVTRNAEMARRRPDLNADIEEMVRRRPEMVCVAAIRLFRGRFLFGVGDGHQPLARPVPQPTRRVRAMGAAA